MNTISHIFEMYHVYEHSTLIISIEGVVMGTTLIALSRSLKNSCSQSKSGLIYLAAAMFMLSVINTTEYLVGVEALSEKYSLSTVIFASSIELFILLMAYMSMISKGFITKRRISIELTYIAVFTAPAMFVSPTNHPLLFDILFVISLISFGVKLTLNLITYRRQIEKIRKKIDNLLSDDSNQWLKWIDKTFYTALTIGIISVLVPMTNTTILVFFNIFVFFSFFYIYISVIQNISIFNKSMAILDNEAIILYEEVSKHPAISIFGRQKFLDDWIADRGYAVAGVTATEVAARLNTNRTRLSQYLKQELNTTYYEWIATLRINDAKIQLTQYPDRSIYEIALNVGIEDRDNFRRVFQRCVGMSPTAYRKNHMPTC